MTAAEPSTRTASWKPSGIVTLTTDFGLVDPYVGMIKGILLSADPRRVIVDVSHGVPPQNIRVGAWFLHHAIAYFPKGTVHLAVVDPGVGSERALLVAEDEGSAFLAPDNGLLPAALSPSARWFELDVARFARPGASRTFHGRDILAPAAAAIAAGLAPEAAGRALDREPIAGRKPAPRRLGSAALEVEVLCADHYGNLLLAVKAEDLEGDLAAWHVEVGGMQLALREAYADAAPGEALALVDSYGVIEIAVREGSAAERLKISPGARVILRRQR